MIPDLVAVVLVAVAGGDGAVVEVTGDGSLCACRGCLDGWGAPTDAGWYRLTWSGEYGPPVVERLPAWPEP